MVKKLILEIHIQQKHFLKICFLHLFQRVIFSLRVKQSKSRQLSGLTWRMSNVPACFTACVRVAKRLEGEKSGKSKERKWARGVERKVLAKGVSFSGSIMRNAA